MFVFQIETEEKKQKRTNHRKSGNLVTPQIDAKKRKELRTTLLNSDSKKKGKPHSILLSFVARLKDKGGKKCSLKVFLFFSLQGNKETIELFPHFFLFFLCLFYHGKKERKENVRSHHARLPRDTRMC